MHARTSVHRGDGSESLQRKACVAAMMPSAPVQSTLMATGPGFKDVPCALQSRSPVLSLSCCTCGESPEASRPPDHIRTCGDSLSMWGRTKPGRWPGARGRTPAEAPRASRLTSGGPPPPAGTNVQSQDAVLPSSPPVSAQQTSPFPPAHSKSRNVSGQSPKVHLAFSLN